MSSLNIALVQTDIAWLNPQSNFNRLESLFESVEHSDLIVLPETFSTGFAFEIEGVAESSEGPALHWLKHIAAQKNTVVTGSVAVVQGDKRVNRLYWVTPQGEVAFYDKRHLFRMGNEHEYVIAGNKRQVFEVKGFRILPLICYDLRFPVWSRNKNDYDAILCVANWPAARRGVWDLLLQARAIENQCFVMAVNRVGDDGRGAAHSGGTAVYDFKGQAISKAQDDKTEVIMTTLVLDQLNTFKQQFPAYLDSDDFEILTGD